MTNMSLRKKCRTLAAIIRGEEPGVIFPFLPSATLIALWLPVCTALVGVLLVCRFWCGLVVCIGFKVHFVQGASATSRWKFEAPALARRQWNVESHRTPETSKAKHPETLCLGKVQDMERFTKPERKLDEIWLTFTKTIEHAGLASVLTVKATRFTTCPNSLSPARAKQHNDVEGQNPCSLQLTLCSWASGPLDFLSSSYPEHPILITINKLHQFSIDFDLGSKPIRKIKRNLENLDGFERVNQYSTQ